MAYSIGYVYYKSVNSMFIQKYRSTNLHFEKLVFSYIKEGKFSPLSLFFQVNPHKPNSNFIPDDETNSALHLCIKKFEETSIINTDVIRLLLENGADINIANKNFESALIQLVSLGNIELSILALEHFSFISLKEFEEYLQVVTSSYVKDSDQQSNTELIFNVASCLIQVNFKEIFLNSDNQEKFLKCLIESERVEPKYFLEMRFIAFFMIYFKILHDECNTPLPKELSLKILKEELYREIIAYQIYRIQKTIFQTFGIENTGVVAKAFLNIYQKLLPELKISLFWENKPDGLEYSLANNHCIAIFESIRSTYDEEDSKYFVKWLFSEEVGMFRKSDDMSPLYALLQRHAFWQSSITYAVHPYAYLAEPFRPKSAYMFLTYYSTELIIEDVQHPSGKTLDSMERSILEELQGYIHELESSIEVSSSSLNIDAIKQKFDEMRFKFLELSKSINGSYTKKIEICLVKSDEESDSESLNFEYEYDRIPLETSDINYLKDKYQSLDWSVRYTGWFYLCKIGEKKKQIFYFSEAESQLLKYYGHDKSKYHASALSLLFYIYLQTNREKQAKELKALIKGKLNLSRYSGNSKLTIIMIRFSSLLRLFGDNISELHTQLLEHQEYILSTMNNFKFRFKNSEKFTAREIGIYKIIENYFSLLLKNSNILALKEIIFVLLELNLQLYEKAISEKYSKKYYDQAKIVCAALIKEFPHDSRLKEIMQISSLEFSSSDDKPKILEGEESTSKKQKMMY